MAGSGLHLIYDPLKLFPIFSAPPSPVAGYPNPSSPSVFPMAFNPYAAGCGGHGPVTFFVHILAAAPNIIATHPYMCPRWRKRPWPESRCSRAYLNYNLRLCCCGTCYGQYQEKYYSCNIFFHKEVFNVAMTV